MAEANFQEYKWSDISVVILGRTISGISAISYKPTKTKTATYGAGRQPRTIQHGRSSYSGSITLNMSEVVALNKAARDAGYKSFLDVEVDIIVSYSNESYRVTTDRIVQASFTEMPFGMTNAEEGAVSSHVLPFIAMDIQEDI